MMATYASYVWSCYGITAAILALNVYLAHRSRMEALKAARRRQQVKSESAP